MSAHAVEPAMSEALRLLLVEDSEDDARLVLRALRRAGYEPDSLRVDSAAALRSALGARAWDAILCDYVIPGFGGLEALSIAKESGLDLPFILVSNKVSEETLVEAMRAGAMDFVMKDRLDRLGPVLMRELADAAARRGLKQSQIEWRAAFDAVQDAMFVHDADFRIVRANLAYAALAGLPVNEIIGKRYWEVFPQAAGPLAVCLRTMQTNEKQEEEVKLESGEIFRSRAVALQDAQGSYTFFIHIMEDITEKRRTESEREQAQEENLRQLDELRRWQALTLAREERYMELKREVNALLRRLGEPIRYPSQEGKAEP